MLLQTKNLTGETEQHRIGRKGSKIATELTGHPAFMPRYATVFVFFMSTRKFIHMQFTKVLCCLLLGYTTPFVWIWVSRKLEKTDLTYTD